MNPLSELHCNDLCLLTASTITMHTKKWIASVDGHAVNLTYIEYLLLKTLMLEKGKVISRKMLLKNVWGHCNVSVLTTRTVDVHVGRLRKKLGSAGDHIVTVRNVGYRMDFSQEWISR
jgi:DNA-binding response OmpR family regulator